MGNTRLKEIAKMYLAEIDEKAFDPEKPQINSRWFNGRESLGKEFPPRMGYWLGYNVAKELSKSVSVTDMVRWDAREAHQKVVEALQVLSK